MSIYSANRTGSFNVAQIPANESYKWNDIGRILCESQANDMAFFEAALACDFTEVKGLREGTILEAEAAEVEKASKEKLFDRLIERLKGLWAKLKGVFQSAINKIAELALDNKKFVKYFDSNVTKEAISKWNGSIKTVVFDTKKKCVTPSAVFESTKIGASVNDAMLHMFDAEGSGRSDVSPSNYAKIALDACKVEETLKSDNIGTYKSAIENAKDAVKALKDKQAELEKAISKQIDAYTKLKANAKEGSHQDSMYNDIINKCHTEEVVLASVVKAAIVVTKEDMKSRRVALRKAMNDIMGGDKAVGEAAVLDDMEAFEDTMNAGLPDEETKKEIDDLVASV